MRLYAMPVRMYRAKAEGRGRAAVFDSSMATQGAIEADPVVVDRIESGVAKKDAEPG
jgi:predicted signal transduction protein with EAL and GGDEF domain